MELTRAAGCRRAARHVASLTWPIRCIGRAAAAGLDRKTERAAVNRIRLRQAYASLAYRQLIEVLAGQTSDLISPVFPSAQTTPQLLFAGNTSDRRPQLQLSNTPSDKIRAAIGVATTGWVSHADLDGDGQIDGMASPKPMLQWLLEYRQRMKGDLLRFGVRGHATSSELADGRKYSGASAGIHLYLPVASELIC